MFKSIIILDWDDTLFPTHWVMKNGINLANENERNNYVPYFINLDKVLSHFLFNISQTNKIIIITNALPEWIKISSIILPQTNKLLKNIKIVSARGKYQLVSSNPMDWKEMAFKNEISKEISNNNILNVISVGDAEYEYKALISLFHFNVKNKNKILKSVKFMKNPNQDVLIDQIQVLDNAINEIIDMDKHLDLKFDNI
jgi:hypothetical protein